MLWRVRSRLHARLVIRRRLRSGQVAFFDVHTLVGSSVTKGQVPGFALLARAKAKAAADSRTPRRFARFERFMESVDLLRKGQASVVLRRWKQFTPTVNRGPSDSRPKF